MSSLFDLGASVATQEIVDLKKRRFSESSQICSNLIDLKKALEVSIYEETSTAKWFLDNYYMLEYTAKEIVFNLKNFKFKHIPSLKESGEMQAYYLAKQCVHAIGNDISLETILEFVEGYQTKYELSVKELLLFPTLMKLVFVQNVIRSVQGFLQQTICEHELEYTAEISSAIQNMYKLSMIKEKDILYRASTVYRVMMNDTVFQHMDDESRDYYVMRVEWISERFGLNETETVRVLMELSNEKKEHIGVFLIGTGEKELLKRIGHHKQRSHKAGLYLFITAWVPAIAAVLVPISFHFEPMLWILAILFYIPLHYIACTIANCIFTMGNKPRFLPRMKEIPPDVKTLVVIPALICSKKDAKKHLDALERFHLANRQENLYFCVFADFKDASHAITEEELQWAEAAQEWCNALNEKYGKRFYYVQRSRTQNKDGVFQGWERKRGALLALAALLRHHATTEYIGPHDLPEQIKYVITLDADTVLTPGTAHKMIGTMCHPLNTPKLSKNGNYVVEGYGILQPAVVSDIESITTKYAELYSGAYGTDSYQGMTSELFHDAFCEATYTGKGIFDVDIYNAVLQGTFQENAILSHDLLEGAYLHAGYLSDVILQDDMMEDYLQAAKRTHRWIRGDWQLLPFLRKHIKNQNGELKENPISVISKYKMVLNLFRSLVPVMSALLMLAGFLYGGLPGLLAQITVLLAYFLGPLITFVRRIVGLILHAKEGARFADVWVDCKETLLQAGLDVIFIPYTALNNIDAILRATYRMFFSHKKMLEWTTAAQASKKNTGTIEFYKKMYINPVFGVAIAFAGLCDIRFLPYALALCVLFAFAPFVAAYISERTVSVSKLPEKAEKFLRASACRIWQFFDDFSDKETLLIPDNVQIYPKKRPVEKVSPTNMAYALISNINAYNFGYIDPRTLLIRLNTIIDAIERMEKWNGHVYNWYDIETLKPIGSKFVSTVDNGNLCAYLLTITAYLKNTDFALDEKKFASALVDYLCTSKINKELENLCASYLQGVISLNAFLKQKQQFKEEPVYRLLERYDSFLENKKIQADAIESVVSRCDALAEGMDFSLLYNEKNKLFHIGYDAVLNTLSNNYYDFLASESRHASIVAIAKGDVPYQHWFRLARPLVKVNDHRVLVSWSGTMFEYLMPLILMPVYQRTLLEETYVGAVAAQKQYALKRKIPFGISESGYYAFDQNMYYQYKAFGVPKLGAMYGLDKDTVVAPYATMLSLLVDAESAFKNLKKFYDIGMYGKYGFYEAVDFTPKRAHLGSKIVKSYMAHHQGMALCAIDDYLHGNILANSFLNVPMIKAVDSLLKEKRPERSIILKPFQNIEIKKPYVDAEYQNTIPLDNTDQRILSNGHYSVCGNTAWLHGKTVYHDFKIFLEKEPLRREVFTILGKQSEKRKYDNLVMQVEKCISPAQNSELCFITVKNISETSVIFDLFCTCKPILTEEQVYRSHPMFHDLFIETEITDTAVIAKKRTDSGSYCMVAGMKPVGFTNVEFESSAIRTTEKNFEGTYGAVINPILGIKSVITLKPSEEMSFVLEMTVEEYAESPEFETSVQDDFENTAILAAYYEQDLLKTYGVPFQESLEYEKIGALLQQDKLYKHEFSAYTEAAAQNKAELYRLGLSLQKPILVVFLAAQEDEQGICNMICWLKQKQVEFDTVILSEMPGGYYLSEAEERLKQYGVCYIKEISEELKATLIAAANIVIDAKKPLRVLFEQHSRVNLPKIYENKCSMPANLMFYNGFGGFAKQGKEYVILYSGKERNFACLSNILSGRDFGTLTAICGYSYTWYQNARLNRITEYMPDKIFQRANEYIVVYDEANGTIYFPLPAPEANSSYCVTIGKGYTIYETEGELSFRLKVSVGNGTYKKSELTILNHGDSRELKVFYLVYPVLGEKYGAEARGIVTDFLAPYAIVARSAISDMNGYMYIAAPGFEIQNRVDFDIENVIGREMQPYLALETKALLPNEKTIDIPLWMGYEQDITNIFAAMREQPEPAKTDIANIQIQTGDAAFDILVNEWLLHQTYQARILGRTGFYQSGGATGFRDQLQDMLCMIYAKPEMVRAHILESAKHQFIEGDVLHWWHGNALGVRTKIVDDRLFLGYVAFEYIRITGDESILYEAVPYLKSEAIPDGKKDLYQEFQFGEQTETLLLHIERAVESVCHFGRHGLPLMWGGDWNDGMDKVGEKGEGESVWMAFFLYDIIGKLQKYTDKDYKEILEKLKYAIEQHAWDGKWYLRAFFDDGTPIGSNTMPECKIDLISQVWAVLSGAAEKSRAREAFSNAVQRLKKDEDSVMLLLTPAFHAWEKNPGYIKGYVAGVRENGGQYTHAAAWAVMAACELGENNLAYEIFSMINPINHSATKSEFLKYRGEPYAVAADVYYAENSKGRAGWTWYTGSASILYKAAIEYILGIQKEGNIIRFNPHLPEYIASYSLRYQYKGKVYTAQIENDTNQVIYLEE